MTLSIFGTDYEIVSHGWEAKQNVKGVVYYVNSALQITSWNHPFLDKVLKELDEYGDVKYAAYRTAMKLRILQTHLGLSWITIEGMKHVFPLSFVEEDDLTMTVNCGEASGLLYRLLEFSDKRHQHTADYERATDLVLNFLLNLYDTNRSGKLVLRSMRNALTALCPSKLCDKYRYFFAGLRDGSGRISREKFLYFIDDLMQITDTIKESTAFGRNLTAAVDSCFKLETSSSPLTVSEDTFYSWLLKEPQTLVWLPTLHRVIATESIQHEVRCAACRSMPITGFRYRCLQCLRYDLCQKCFLLGRTSLSHKLKHPMQEYCFPTTAKEDAKAVLKIVRNKLSKKHRSRTKVTYLPVDGSGDHQAFAVDWQPRGLGTYAGAPHTRSTDSGLAGSSDYGDSLCGDGLRVSRPVEVLGEPCQSSSPFFKYRATGNEELSKRDIQTQQKLMALTIEQLRQENCLLQTKLRDLERGFSTDSSEEEQDLPTGSPISPINETRKTSAATSGLSVVGSSADVAAPETTLNIVGIYTPVVSSLPPPDMAEGNMTGESVAENKTGYTTETSDDLGLAYTMSDMTLSSKVADPGVTQESLRKSGNSLGDLSSSGVADGLGYRSGDMSLYISEPCVASLMRPETNDQGMSKSFLQTKSEDSFDCPEMQGGKSEDNDKIRKFTDLEILSPVKKEGNRNSPKSRDTSISLSPSRDCDLSDIESDLESNLEQTPWTSRTPDIFNDFDKKMQSSAAFPSQDVTGKADSPAPGVSNLKPETSVRSSMAPVHMSTPVCDTAKRSAAARASGVKLPKSHNRGEDKENQGTDVGSGTKKMRLDDKAGVLPTAATPLSAIPVGHRRKILASSRLATPNFSQSCQNLTHHSAGGLSAMFTEAELKACDTGGDTMVTVDKEEMEKMLREFQKDGSPWNGTDDPVARDDRQNGESSMLEAVLNIGDAMADLVQATTQQTHM
ncbi:dystrophin [Aplysia californica]|uniref:Dystrophin n=1 Tax=Aplysia californica TaxID=6500 RepID=A0ABM0JZD6_APLCA|nr:dystrophin [Aplysia californica]